MIKITEPLVFREIIFNLYNIVLRVPKRMVLAYTTPSPPFIASLDTVEDPSVTTLFDTDSTLVTVLSFPVL